LVATLVCDNGNCVSVTVIYTQGYCLTMFVHVFVLLTVDSRSCE